MHRPCLVGTPVGVGVWRQGSWRTVWLLMGGIAAVSTDAGSRVTVAASDNRARRLASTIAWGGVCLWILCAPFEGLHPLVQLPGQSISSVEGALLGVFAAWTVAIVWTRAWPEWRTPLTAPWIAFPRRRVRRGANRAG